MSAPAGPYTVTHRQERGGVARLGSLGEPEVLSRWAYATLEEATRVVDRAKGLQRRPGFEYHGGLPESGGTIKLPDGEIVVEATTWDRLLTDLPPNRILLGPDPSPVTAAEILAAWNAEYGIGEGA